MLHAGAQIGTTPSGMADSVRTAEGKRPPTVARQTLPNRGRCGERALPERKSLRRE
jgi:hypothetical protein